MSQGLYLNCTMAHTYASHAYIAYIATVFQTEEPLEDFFYFVHSVIKVAGVLGY